MDFHFAGRVIQDSFACSGIYAARPRCAPSAEKGEGRDRGHLCKPQMTKVQPQRFGPWTCQAVRHPEHGRKTRDRKCPAVPPHDEIRTSEKGAETVKHPTRFPSGGRWHQLIVSSSRYILDLLRTRCPRRRWGRLRSQPAQLALLALYCQASSIEPRKQAGARDFSECARICLFDKDGLLNLSLVLFTSFLKIFAYFMLDDHLWASLSLSF